MAQLVTEITTDLEPTVISIIKQIVASAKVDLSSQQESLVNTIMVQMKPVVTAAVNNALRTSSYQVSSAYFFTDWENWLGGWGIP